MKKVVVNGTFDLIHPGHIHLLNYARSLGDYLLVAIDSDQRVKQLKGHNRPIQSLNVRKFILENIRSVDQVQSFATDLELENILELYQPDIMVKGSDYRDKPIVGERFCRSIVFFERMDIYSTTNTIESIDKNE